jgi:hypothetical protein
MPIQEVQPFKVALEGIPTLPNVFSFVFDFGRLFICLIFVFCLILVAILMPNPLNMLSYVVSIPRNFSSLPFQRLFSTGGGQQGQGEVRTVAKQA